MKPDVSLCIPAWQSEAFIEKTLGYARNQTYSAVRILVSVDQCTDRTADICARIAAEDSRIRIFRQDRRQGWAGNVNFLLSRVETPLFFFYWHDDVIPRDYVERLASALVAHPMAMSAYGNTRHFGAYSGVDVGKSFMGSASERLIEVLTSPRLFGLARSMMRKEILSKGLRIPQRNGRDYYENNTPYFVRMLASGPILHVPEAEYQRLNGTGSSVVDGWLRLPKQEVIESFRCSARDCIQILREEIAAPAELESVMYCLYLFLMWRLRMYEAPNAADALVEPGEVAVEFDGIQGRNILHLFNDAQRQGVVKAQARLFCFEGEFWRRKEEWEKAIMSFAAAAVLDPDSEPARRSVAGVLAARGLVQGAHAINEMSKAEINSTKVSP